MSNPYFKFKQFTVWHDKCAMKVGTDGVLLGAWADTENCQHILDIGTGTGLIALMLAQRSRAIIDAIDIDESASLQASENVSASPFRNQIRVQQADIRNFARKTPAKYDLIVSNPPYFIQSLKSPEEQRNRARHTDTLSLEELITESIQLIKSTGKMAFILPAQNETELEPIRKQQNLYLTKRLAILPTPDFPPKRILVELSFEKPTVTEQNQLIIEISRHQYTQEYKELTREYYLKM
ncbi:MAG: methyltransferase [Tannerellaceae bacterium]|nr:methyltransferase [Tannerellaceae bacterium]